MVAGAAAADLAVPDRHLGHRATHDWQLCAARRRAVEPSAAAALASRHVWRRAVAGTGVARISRPLCCAEQLKRADHLLLLRRHGPRGAWFYFKFSIF